ncbi:MAG: hypothetical protein ACOY0T_22865 [Myxococcota bacterium]
MKKSVLGPVGLALGALVSSVPAAATTYDHSMGTAVAACQKGTASGAASYDWTGMLNSSTTETMVVECGDFVSWGNSGMPSLDVDAVQVWVWDRSSTANVSCAMKVVGYAGEVVYSGALQSTTGSNSSQTMALTWGVPAGIAGLPYVSCSVPARSGTTGSGVSVLWSWRIQE